MLVKTVLGLHFGKLSQFSIFLSGPEMKNGYKQLKINVEME